MSRKETPSREVSMWSDWYAEESPFGFPKYQLPPTSSLASKHVYGRPQSLSALPAVRPLIPAPMMQLVGFAAIGEESRGDWPGGQSDLLEEVQAELVEELL